MVCPVRSLRSCEIIEHACRLGIAFGSPGSAGVPPANHVYCYKYEYARETRALPGRSIRCQRELIFSHLLTLAALSDFPNLIDAT